MTSLERADKGSAGQRPGANGHALPIAVDLVVSTRCFGSAVAVTRDVLSTANLLSAQLGGPSPLFEISTRSVDGEPVVSSSGAEIPVEGAADACRGALMVVFGPGMADVNRVLADLREPSTTSLGAVLRDAQDRGATICASCSSTFLLAEAGLLDGHSATTSWWLAPLFRARYPEVELLEDDLVVRSRRTITAGAALAQIDLALHLVRELVSPELAHACARYLVVDDARRSQAPFVVIEHLTRGDELVARAEAILREDLRAPVDVAALARSLAVTSRTLSRRFVAATGLPPARFQRRLRLETAAARLRATGDAIEAIAADVGYDDERSFRRAFAKELGVSPARFRRGVSPAR
ncbi:MAG: helix-turn-helix domain-containing protein [Sandaracinaceae bacterium]